MDTPIHNPHDSFVRKVLDDPKVARDLLQHELPQILAQQLNLTTLERINASYVSKSLRQSYSDMVFRVQLADSQRSAYIYTLFEHKSQPDDWCQLQLLKYMVAQWEEYHQKQPNSQLPPVIPIVLYHGQQGWKRRELVALLDLDDPEVMRPYTPKFDYVLWDVAQMDRQKLELNLESRAFLDLLYHIQRHSLVDVLPQITAWLKQATDNRASLLEKVETYLRYAVYCNEFLDEDVIRQSLEASDTMEELMPTLAKKWFDQARQEGHQEGVQQGLHTGQAQLLRNQILIRFGAISTSVEKRIMEATDEDLQRFAANIFDATTAEDVVGLKH